MSSLPSRGRTTSVGASVVLVRTCFTLSLTQSCRDASQVPARVCSLVDVLVFQPCVLSCVRHGKHVRKSAR